MNMLSPPARTFRLHETWGARFLGLTIPIIPPAARMSPGSKVPPDQRGKVPGVRGADGWHSYDWRRAAPSTPADHRSWDADGASVGLRLGASVVALDVDVTDAAASHAIADLARTALAARFPRIGRPPRLLFLLRVAEGEATITKRRVEWVLAGQRMAVELLGDGQQCVIAGTHPGTGQPYGWPEGEPRGVWDLPAVTVAQLDAFFAKLSDLLDMLGADAVRAGQGAASDGPPPDPASLIAPSAEILAEAVAAIPNTKGYDDWIRMLRAIRAAAQGLCDDEGEAIAAEWTERATGEGFGGGAHIGFDEKWRQQTPPWVVGWPQIELRARGAGWAGSAQLDFADVALPAEDGPGMGEEALPAASGASGSAILRDMNRSHVFVMIGGKARIARDDRDAHGHRVWTYSAPADLKMLYRPRPMPGPKSGCRVDAWMGMEDRRTARGITFAPGEPEITRAGFLNEWRGFAVLPAPRGSCQRFREHALGVVCRGDERHFAYFWGWLAHLVQRPMQKPGVAVVLRGVKGAGKTVVGDYMAAILGRHAAKVSKREHLLGRFNAHLATSLLVQVEEAIWAGDKAAEGELKDLITSDSGLLERKGVDAVPIPSFQRFLFTSNEGWVVPATFDERRFFVLDVSPARQGDAAYFAGLFAERDSGGPGALLRTLLAEDLAGFDVRFAPRTVALAEQIERSLPPTIAWWRECLTRGYVTDRQRVFVERDGAKIPQHQGAEWHPFVRRDLLQESFTDFCAKQRLGSHLPPLNVVAADLAPWLPEGKLADGPRSDFPAPAGDRRADPLAPHSTRPRTYRLPPLADCRRAFERRLGARIAWGDT
jgi:hypothetical protein